jgi:hypothetical protein
MIEGSGSIPLTNGSGSERPGSGTLIEMVVYSGAKAAYLRPAAGVRGPAPGDPRHLCCAHPALLHIHGYRQGGSLPHFASYIGKLPLSEPLDFFWLKAVYILFPDRRPQEGSFNMSENKWDR